MRRAHAAVIVVVVLAVTYGPAGADDPKAKAILDRAIKALGGEEKLAKIEAFSWKSKVKFGAAGKEMDAELIFKGLDHMRRAYDVNLVVLAGDKGWVKARDVTKEMSDQAIAFQKRSIYLQAIPIILLPIKRSNFKYEAAGEERIGDKPALGLKITGPDGKDFTLFFDKETGLPVKEVAQVHLPGNEGTTAQTTFSDYKDFGGIKKATRIESSGFGTGFSQIITDFQVLEKVDDGTFAKPK
jgi:zinc protease